MIVWYIGFETDTVTAKTTLKRLKIAAEKTKHILRKRTEYYDILEEFEMAKNTLQQLTEEKECKGVAVINNIYYII